jgi:hypothetical protein
MNPQAIRVFYQLDDVGFTPQLELPGVTIGLIREFLPKLENQDSVRNLGANTLTI